MVILVIAVVKTELLNAFHSKFQELKREVSRLNTAQVTSSRQLDEAAMSRILDNYFSTNNYQVQRLEECVKNILVMVCINAKC